jgi:hypothetical protein
MVASTSALSAKPTTGAKIDAVANSVATKNRIRRYLTNFMTNVSLSTDSSRNMAEIARNDGF